MSKPDTGVPPHHQHVLMIGTFGIAAPWTGDLNKTPVLVRYGNGMVVATTIPRSPFTVPALQLAEGVVTRRHWGQRKAGAPTDAGPQPRLPRTRSQGDTYLSIGDIVSNSNAIGAGHQLLVFADPDGSLRRGRRSRRPARSCGWHTSWNGVLGQTRSEAVCMLKLQPMPHEMQAVMLVMDASALASPGYIHPRVGIHRS